MANQPRLRGTGRGQVCAEPLAASVQTMATIRTATEQDWPRIYPFYAAIVAEGRTYAFPEGQTLDEARPWWMESAPGQTVVAVAGDTILGSAKMGPNRPGRGAHVATAAFMIDAAYQGQGIGRLLGEYMIGWARSSGFHAIQFNAVVETNTAAVHLWQSLGFAIVGTVPEAFDEPTAGLVGLHIMFLRLRPGASGAAPVANSDVGL